MAYSPEIQAVLKKMKEAKNINMFRRYQAIYLWLKGRKQQEIADTVRVCRKTVINYINSYKEDGLDGLIPGKPTGQPKFLSDEQEDELKNDIIKKVPADFEEFTSDYNWTVKIVRAHIKNKFNVEYSQSGANKLMHRLGFSFTRPTYTLEKADPEKQEKFKQDFKDIKKN